MDSIEAPNKGPELFGKFKTIFIHEADERENGMKLKTKMATLNLDSSPPVSPAVAPREAVAGFQHTPCYCEENVYLLSKKLCDDGISTSDGSDLFIIFISNEQKQIPLWHQKASHRADGVILWDYHAICLQKRKESNLPHLVWDLDSTLPCPSPLAKYVAETIRPSFQLFSQFQRIFRIVHAPLFLRCFASDRRHMKDSAGNWVSSPPSYEAIVAEDGTLHNLNEYMEMSSVDVVKTVGADTVDAVLSQKLGVLISESQLEEFFSMSISENHVAHIELHGEASMANFVQIDVPGRDV